MSALTAEERRKWIGGSEIAALLGHSPYSTAFELYWIKKGELDDPEGDERMIIGQEIELGIARAAMRKWSQWSLSKVDRYIPHPTVPGMGVSLDFTDVRGHPVDVKNVDFTVFRDQWCGPDKKPDTPPLHVLLQLQQQMDCTNAPLGEVLACVGGNKLHRFLIPRHEPTIEAIHEAVNDFWDRYRRDDPPKPDFKNDAAAVIKLHQRVGGLSADLSTHNRLPFVCDDYLAFAAAAAVAEKGKESCRAEILAIIGDAPSATTRGYSISAGMVHKKEHVVQAVDYRMVRITKKKGDALGKALSTET